MLSCRVFGHRMGFSTQGRTMRWGCERCGQVMGAKEYPTEEEARRTAAAFDRGGTDDRGQHRSLVGMLPVRIWRALVNRSHEEPPDDSDR